MIRLILLFILLMLVFQSLKVVFRSARRVSHGEDGRRRIRGEEMVQDPQCRTYVIKDRAVVRSIGGKRAYFCSEDCAQKFEAGHRG